KIAELLLDLVGDDRVLVGVTDEGMGNIGHLALSRGQRRKVLSKLSTESPRTLEKRGQLETAFSCHAPKNNLKDNTKFEMETEQVPPAPASSGCSLAVPGPRGCELAHVGLGQRENRATSSTCGVYLN